MRAVPVFLVAALIAGPAPSVAAAASLAAAPSAQARVIVSFDGQRTAVFPDGWKARDRAAAERVYRVASEDGEQFLRAVANGESEQIGFPVSFDIEDYPLLSWRWRVRELPAGARERDAATNDSAAGVYVVFKGSLGGLLPRAIKYVWSTREPQGTAIQSPGYSNSRIVVLETGAEHLGTWLTETVNVLEDYRRLFGSEPPDMKGLALLTDADDTGSRASADYGAFSMLPLDTAGASAARIARPAR